MLVASITSGATGVGMRKLNFLVCGGKIREGRRKEVKPKAAALPPL